MNLHTNNHKEEATMEENTTTEVVEEETHRNLYEVMFDFFMEFINIFKYLFYDIWLGK